MNLLLYSNLFYIITSGVLFLRSRKYKKRLSLQKDIEKTLKSQLAFIQTIVDSLPNMVALRNKEHQLILCNKAYKETLTVDFWLRLDSRFKEQYLAEYLQVWEHGREISGLHIYTDARDHQQKHASYSRRLCLDSQGNKIGQLMVLTDVTPIKDAEQRAREAENRLTDMTDSMPGMVFQYLWRGPDNGRFLYTSRGIEAILGVIPPEVIDADGGGNRLFGFTEEIRLQFIRDIAEHAQSLEPVDLEVTVPRKDGVHYLQVRGNFVAKDDGSRILNGVIQDITNLKLQEFELRSARLSAEKAMQIRSHFLATMSHELRTPISGLHGMLELLQMSDLTVEQRYMVRSGAHSTNTLLYLVNDLLDFSKMEAGEFQLHYHSCQLQSTVCDVIRGYVATASSKNLSVNIDWDPAIPHRAIIDPVRVGQIISNLLNNAVKFTHEGSINIKATFLDKDQLTITVSDTGIGIPEDKQHRLFTPFDQIDSDINRRYGGTGLGLAICKQLIGKMGGNISAKSDHGFGSHFTFSLPLRECEWQSSALVGSEWLLLSKNTPSIDLLSKFGANLRLVNEPTDLEMLSGFLLADEECLESLFGSDWLFRIKLLPLKGIIFSGREPLRNRLDAAGWWRLGTSPLYPDLLIDTCHQLLSKPSADETLTPLCSLHGRILVADDHPVNRELLARQLALFNLDVVLVNNGEQALSAWFEQHFDLLITDLHMPIMDGYTLSRTLRENNVKAPVIGITADISPKTSKLILACGMNDVLPKPYSVESLHRVLLQWLPDTLLGGAVLIDAAENHSIARSWITLFGDDNVARSMAEEYIRVCQEDCHALTEILANDKLDELSALAHRLKGTASIANHDELEKKAAHLEKIVRSTSDESLQELVQSIQIEIECYFQQTRAWING
jgi:signal transduction histidine kinase/CheY-like chemotaxis protein